MRIGLAEVLTVDLGTLGVLRSLARLDKLTKLRIDGDGSKERHRELLSHDLSAPRAEDVGAFGAVRADEAAHVLDDAEHFKAGLDAKVELLLDVGGCDGLRSCDDHRARHLAGSSIAHESLCERNVLVTGARRGVNEEVVSLVPEDV